MVIDGELKFSITSKLDESTTIELSEIFRKKLEEIICHTVNQTRSYKTASDIDNIISQEYLDRIQGKKEIEEVYLANSLQQGFIYHTLNQGDVDDAYIVQSIWQYNNELDIDKLKKAWTYAQLRYSALRLRLAWQEELIQIIDKEGSLDWRYIDLTQEQQDKEIQEHKIREIQENDRFEPYNLEQGSLFRIYIIKQKRNLYTCIFSNHHAILDGWSNPILLGYVHETYLKLEDKKIVEVLIDHSYEYAQKYLQNHQYDNKNYWDKYISQIEERSNLSGLLSNDSRRKNLKISEYKHIIDPQEELLIIKDSLYNNLKKLNQKEGVTLNAILQYVWHKTLNIYGNSNQTIVGTTVSGRNIAINDIESSVGLYINTLPLIVDHQSQRSNSIIESIKSIQNDINEINSRSSVSLAKLQKRGYRLFDSLFIYENYPDPKNEELQNRLKISFKGGTEKLDYPLAVIAYESNNQLSFALNYAGEIFSKDTIDELLSITITLLKQIVGNVYQSVQNEKYLNSKQYNKIINIWNKTDKDYPNTKTIHHLFEEQVERTPDSIAVVYENRKLTYRELNERANQLANYIIQNYAIGPDALIALCLDRSEYMLIAILGVLKSGAAYVPMDPSYPDERIKYILEDTNSLLVLTNKVHNERLERIINTDLRVLIDTKNDLNNDLYKEINHQTHVLAIDHELLKDQLSLQLISNPKTNTKSTNLAYIIYTSGTTGNPKGVMIEHKGVVNLQHALTGRYEFTNSSQENLLQLSNYIFDASIEQIVVTLLNGHTLVGITSSILFNTENFSYYLNANKISQIDGTPTLINQYNLNKTRCLKRIVYGGEVLDIQSKIKIFKNKQYKIVNTYGPTETTITSTINIIKDYNNISIGTPISNTKVYVLSNDLTALPIGAIGELYIGGIGVGRGYLNRADLTAEKFIANPFQSEEERKKGKNSRLYKTGDLVRWLSDGNLEYIGRNDFQVKIRGYRIELGEIENCLSEYEGINQSVVLDRVHKGTDNKYLVGYYVSDSKLEEESILEYLGSKLPEYMVPTILGHGTNL